MAKRLNPENFNRRGGRRPEGSRLEKKYYLIVCEGEKTETLYFQVIKDRLPPMVVDIEILGEGMNTTSLVKIARQRAKERSIRKKRKYDAVWCVFDRDSFGPQLYNTAIAQCDEDELLQAAYTNEAFEFWLLLHYDLIESALGRNVYDNKLSDRLSKGKTKVRYDHRNKEQMRTIFNAGWQKAIRHAYKIDEMWAGREDHAEHCPRTRVHVLVEELMGMAGQ